MVEESLAEYKIKVARKKINSYNFNAGFAIGAAMTIGIIILSLRYFISLNPKLLGFVNMIIIESPEIMTILYIIEIAIVLLFATGVILAYLAYNYEDKISKGYLNFVE